MALFNLPATSPDINTAFTDAPTCSAWLQTLPLINVAPVQGTLLAHIEEFNAVEVAAAERLKILEVLREPVFFVQTELTRKFAGRALPLPRLERDIFLNVTALWVALGQGYQHCLEAVAAGDLIGQGALSCQRALDCVARKVIAHHNAYQDIKAEDWRLAHDIFLFAEERGLEQIDVSDALCKTSTLSTSEQTWLRLLLLNLANPNEQSPRQLAMIGRWLERWAKKVTVSKQVKPSPLPPLAVDLAGSAGASRQVPAGAGARHLGMDELSASMKKRIVLLRKGESPQALKLGEDCVQPFCEQNLLLLYRQLCEISNARNQSRQSSSNPTQVATGIAAIHHHICGRPFKQPGNATELSKKQRDEIATFGRIATRAESDYVKAQGYAVELWTLLDESLTGLRMRRSAATPGTRVAHLQLLGVRPSDSRHFILGTVRWLQSTDDLDLIAGVRIAPGVPQAIAVKPTGINAQTEKYVAALIQPEVAALRAPASLVLPSGWFRPKRVIDIWHDGRDTPQQALLTAILERGIDFERVSFEAA